jgi:FMN-dependent NADH-azoreductase
MIKLLFIQASPRSFESKSLQIAQIYLETLRAETPDLQVDTLDLWEADLPAFDGDKVAAKLNIILGKDHDSTQKSAWNQIVSVANRFISADRYLFAVPMWNGGVPYRLKQYIDIIHQPGLLFGLNPETGYFGLLENKHVMLVLTSGVFAPNRASPAFGVDHHSTYLRSWLNQAGISAIDEVRFQPTLLTTDPDGDLERAKHEARRLARMHGRAQTALSAAV